MLIASACSTKHAVKIESPPPFDLACDASEVKCFGECPALGEWKARADGTGDFDELAQLGIDDAKKNEQCKAKLKACQACIERGRQKGIIR